MEISLGTRLSRPSRTSGSSNWLPWTVSLLAHAAVTAGIVAMIRLSPPATDAVPKDQTVFVDVEPAPDTSPAAGHHLEPLTQSDPEPLHPVAAKPVQPRLSEPVHGSQIVDLPTANGEEPDAGTPYVAEKSSRVAREQRGKYGSPQNAGTGAVDTGQDTSGVSKGIFHQKPGESAPAVPPAPKPGAVATGENQLLSLSDELKPPPPVTAPADTQGAGVVGMEKAKPVGPVASLSPARPGSSSQMTASGTCPNPPCSQTVIGGDIGTTTDFLTGIETSGDITLLNAKSVAHAGFVRRVATNVFNQFIRDYRSKGWRIDPSKLDDSLRVDAILGQDGSQEAVFIRQSSGMKMWDDMGLEAMKRGAWDSNPPKGSLAADGKVHFVFIVNHRQGILMAGIL